MQNSDWMGSPTVVKWLAGVIFAIGLWVSKIEHSLRGKAEKGEIAKDPVERPALKVALDQIGVQIANIAETMNEQHKSIRDGVKGLDQLQRQQSKDIATLMERTK